MSKPRKFRKGLPLTPEQAFEVIWNNQYVYLGDSPKHPGFMKSMHLRTIGWMAKRGRIYQAIRTNNDKRD